MPGEFLWEGLGDSRWEESGDLYRVVEDRSLGVRERDQSLGVDRSLEARDHSCRAKDLCHWLADWCLGVTNHCRLVGDQCLPCRWVRDQAGGHPRSAREAINQIMFPRRRCMPLAYIASG